jgi:hypothetical protein
MTKRHEKLNAFIAFISEMDNMQAERSEYKLLVDKQYWRWSKHKLLKRIRKVGNLILRKGKPTG